MSVTFSQKLGFFSLPVGAVLLAWATSGPDWKPTRMPRSWREAMEAKARSASAGSGPTEAPAPAPEPPKPAENGKGKKKGAKAPPAEKPPEAAPSPPGETPAAPEAPPEKPAAPAGPAEVEFRLTGLSRCRTAAPLTFPTSQRLDLHVTTSGGVRIGPAFADPEQATGEIKAAGSDKKSGGILYLIPNERAPWDVVRDLAVAGVGANWQKVALGVASPENPGQGRVLLLDIPSTEAPTKKGLEMLTVKVLPGAGTAHAFEVNGEKCEGAEALGKKARAFHQDYEEGFEAGYSDDPNETPWTVDGSGATAGGVVAALDALRTAGVKAVRLAGIRRP